MRSGIDARQQEQIDRCSQENHCKALPMAPEVLSAAILHFIELYQHRKEEKMTTS
jgi:hypothetical protein